MEVLIVCATVVFIFVIWYGKHLDKVAAIKKPMTMGSIDFRTNRK